MRGQIVFECSGGIFVVAVEEHHGAGLAQQGAVSIFEAYSIAVGSQRTRRITVAAVAFAHEKRNTPPLRFIRGGGKAIGRFVSVGCFGIFADSQSLLGPM